MNDEKIFDPMGRIELPDPPDESLIAAAEDCLGDADDTLLPDGSKLFKSTIGGGIYLAPAGEPVGEPVEHASRDIKQLIMAEAGRVRAHRDDAEREKYLNPETNPMIKW